MIVEYKEGPCHFTKEIDLFFKLWDVECYEMRELPPLFEKLIKPRPDGCRTHYFHLALPPSLCIKLNGYVHYIGGIMELYKFHVKRIQAETN